MPASHFDKCMQDMADLATKFGLMAHEYCSTSEKRPNRLGGQMLQIFIHRSEVEHSVYNSLPYGVPIPTDSVDRWLAGEDPQHQVDGQVRILVYPDIFLDHSRGRIFHYCGDWEFLGGSPDMEGSRAAFVVALRDILRPVLSTVSPEDMRKKLTGETDKQRASRLQQEKTARKHAIRSNGSKQRLATSKSNGGYPVSEGKKKKGKK
jgi:hypothetical protein